MRKLLFLMFAMTSITFAQVPSVQLYKPIYYSGTTSYVWIYSGNIEISKPTGHTTSTGSWTIDMYGSTGAIHCYILEASTVGTAATRYYGNGQSLTGVPHTGEYIPDWAQVIKSSHLANGAYIPDWTGVIKSTHLANGAYIPDWAGVIVSSHYAVAPIPDWASVIYSSHMNIPYIADWTEAVCSSHMVNGAYIPDWEDVICSSHMMIPYIADWEDAVSPSSHVAAGVLPADVICSSVGANTIGIKNLQATGSASASTYLRGDNSWATPAGGGGGAVYRSIPLPGIGACYVTTDYVKAGPLPCDMTISSWTVDLTSDGTAPVGGEGIWFDVYYTTGGSAGSALESVFSSTKTLGIVPTAKWGEAQSPKIMSFKSGAMFRLDIKGIGTTTAGGGGNWVVAGWGKDD